MLLEGNRHVVAAALSGSIFLLLTGTGGMGAITLENPAAVRGVAGG